MTPRQRAEFDRLRRRCVLLEQRNRELGRPPRPRRERPLPKDAIDRLVWLRDEIVAATLAGGRKSTIQVTRDDARKMTRLLQRLIQLSPTGGNT